MDLWTTTTVLVELRCTLCQDGGRSRRKLLPIVFAASLKLETGKAFVHSLDHACLKRVRAATRYDLRRIDPVVNYEMEPSFVWQGFEEAKLAIVSLTEMEIRDQLDLMAKRGYRDSILVQMVIEVGEGDGMKGEKCA
ncbi:hypothetical protein B0T25DRAFT_174585 [Lasiosphaeria hispida]|uniref:Uncharacterized protein n=1 Tax=Lasiosphaeria hispida TaxID=260671 RepID=A0AAJ0HNE8_9PEZI|nr:hypothetical protein B0T25DRAFT_174585 [Lasiosphaeria hispida]